MNRFILLVLVLVVVAACGGGGGDNPIEPPPPPPPRSDISTLQLGEFRVLAPSDIPNGIDLPTVSDARDFVIIVGNTNPIQDVVASYVVRGNLSAGGSLRAEQRVALSPQMIAGLGALERSALPQRLLEQRVRGFERKALAFRGRSDPWGISGLSLRRNTQVVAAPVPGDVINVKVPDGNGNNLCQDFFTTQAVVASVSQKAILAVDTLDGPPLGLFTQGDFDAIAAEFDNITYPADESYFGVPTDVDLNGRIIILFTGRVNELTPRDSPAGSGFVGGFFFAGDFFPPTGPPNQSCAQSNLAEIFYLLAPDPGGLKYGNNRTVASVRQGTRGTIAHEFEHMINAGRRYIRPCRPGEPCSFETSWLDEGLAHLSEEVVGRRLKNFGDLQSLTFSDVFPDEAGRNDFNAFFIQNLARLSYWMQRPDTSAAIGDGATANLASRGAAWALIRYSADNFSNSDPRAFTRRLVAGPDTGLTNFNNSTGAPLDTVLAGWLVANYADDLPGVPVVNARSQYRSFNMRSVMPPVAAAVLSTPAGVYPLRVEALSGAGTSSLPGTNRTGSGTYYVLSVAANAGPKNVKVLDAGGTTVVTFLGAHVYVLRIR